MFSVTQAAVPEDSLLRTYRGGARPECWQGQGDCFAVYLDKRVSLADFVLAFYTSPVFRVERFILCALAGARSTDAQARQLADGADIAFAVWHIGERTATQLLMCDRYEWTAGCEACADEELGGRLIKREEQSVPAASRAEIIKQSASSLAHGPLQRV